MSRKAVRTTMNYTLDNDGRPIIYYEPEPDEEKLDAREIEVEDTGR